MTKETHREKSLQTQKLDSDVRDMEGKLTRADKSVGEDHRRIFSSEIWFRLLRIKKQHVLHDDKRNH